MSIQINLLPDIRQAKIRARHTRQLAAGIAAVICSVSAGLVVLLLVITTAQKLEIGKLTSDISQNQHDLASKTDLQQIVTLQQHLDSLPTIYSAQPSFSAFLKAIEAVDPTEVSFASIDLTELTTLKATGKARSMSSVDKLVKAMSASKDASGSPKYTDVRVTTESQDPTVGIVFDLNASVSQGVTHATK